MLNNNGRRWRTPIIYLLILAAIVLLASGMDLSGTKPEEISYMDFLQMAEKGEISAVEVEDRELVGLKKDSKIDAELFPAKSDFHTVIPSQYRLQEDLAIMAARKLNKDVEDVTTAEYGFTYEPAELVEASIWEIILPYIIIFGAFGLFFYFMMQSQGGGNKVMSFGKSRARVQTDMKNKVTFADVAGEDEEKAELMEVVDFMRNPKRFTVMGARIPKGVLLVGPPGTGKTLLAKACAGEADVPFYSISGSDFVEMFVGVGASRVRDLFTTAKKTAPAIIFIDEIDAVGRQRGAGLGGGHDEREQTLNQLLVEMDGFAVNEGIIVIAATNRPDILDPALLRPGRFDRQITVNVPDVKGREEILKVHAKGKPLADDVDLSVLAKRTSGFTGADLENVLNEAAILSARFKKKVIDMPELEEAITRTVVGPEKRSRLITEEDKKITAYHEAGHAIVAHCLPHCDPVHEVSIIPRGMAAGYTMIMPDNDNSHISRGKMLDQICMSMGGRVAESIALDDICTGAIQDLKQATDVARKMVIEYGMSEAIGPVFLGGDTEVFIAKDWGHQRNFSEQVAARVDAEVRRILEEQYDRARGILQDHREALERVVAALNDYERITGEEFVKIFNGEQVELTSFREQQARLMTPDEEVLKQEEEEAKAKADLADDRPKWEMPVPEPESDMAQAEADTDEPGDEEK
ncbi:MAG: ATP-dependent zinc metalloprotease FtsH [Clostridia bacterium]|nr:ATP-dependent zinc metalloprotease FtsH [Clostridia bacterium]